MFPKKGKGFPGTGGTRGELDYAASVATALRSELGDSHRAIKTVMRWTGATDRTAKNWVTGIRGPRGEHLISYAVFCLKKKKKKANTHIRPKNTVASTAAREKTERLCAVL